MAGLAAALAVVQAGVGLAYPGAALSCGRAGVELAAAVGSAEAGTWFDLASLTKALCTSVLAMRLHDAGRLDLDEPVPGLAAPGPPVRVWHLLAHCSGLPPGPPLLWAEQEGLLAAPSPATRAQVIEMARRSPRGLLAEKSVYSDLGFILLGDLLEQRQAARLDALFAPLAEALAAEVSFWPLDQPAAEARRRCAPTRRESPAREPLHGQVHDDNARAMQGVAAHAGLFGTAAGVHRFAAALLDAYHDLGTPAQRALGIRSATVRRFFARCQAEGLSTTWGLGWDHPDPLPAGGAAGASAAGSPLSSAGHLWPRSGVGHLGFTGCSLWLDLERRGVAVLLSNRVYVETESQASATKAALRLLRPALHNAIQRAWA
jgi:CubicO group peptidase (beta-lactamase class C family)